MSFWTICMVHMSNTINWWTTSQSNIAEMAKCHIVITWQNCKKWNWRCMGIKLSILCLICPIVLSLMDIWTLKWQNRSIITKDKLKMWTWSSFKTSFWLKFYDFLYVTCSNNSIIWRKHQNWLLSEYYHHWWNFHANLY